MKNASRISKATKNSKRKAEREKRRTQITQETRIHEAMLVLQQDGSPMGIDEIVAWMPKGLRCSGRALSAALRIERRAGRVLLVGKRYSLAPPISADGLAGMPSRSLADDVAPVTSAPVTPTMPSPRMQTIVPPPVKPAPPASATPQPPPGFARDLAERQAFAFSTARERIASVLTRAGLHEGTSAEPGLLVRVQPDGLIALRWGVKVDGKPQSCAWTEAAEQALERASAALHDAGYKATVGGPSASAITAAGVERAGIPMEAAQRVKELEARLVEAKGIRDAALADRDVEQMEVDALRGYLKDSQEALAREVAMTWEQGRTIKGLEAGLAAMAERRAS
jgi:hypothetical protein